MPDEDVQINLSTVIDGAGALGQPGSLPETQVPYPGTAAGTTQRERIELLAPPPDFAEPAAPNLSTAFKDANARRNEIVGNVRNIFADSGRFGEVIARSPDYLASVNDLLDLEGLSAPPSFAEPPRPFVAAQSRRKELEAGVQDRFTNEGRFGEVVSRSAEYKSALSDALSGEGLDTPLSEPKTPRAYEEAQSKSRAIEQDLQDEFTESGRMAQIGNEEYQKDFRNRREAAGIEKRQTPFDRLKEDKTGLAFGLGFSAISVGSGVAGLAEENSGQYVSPEQQSTALSGAILPGAGGILGTLVGSLVGGAPGGLAGQFIGGAAGEAGQAFVGASNEREQATREAAERLSAALGEATSQVSVFKAQIEATGAPVQQLSKALDSVGSVGVAGQNTIAGTGALVNAFGENSDRNFAAISRYTSDPLLSGIGQKFAAGNGSVGDIQSLGFAAAERGDFNSLKTFQQAAEEASVKNNTNYQQAAGHLNDVSSSQFGLGKLQVGFAKFYRGIDSSFHNDITDALDAEDAEKKQAGAGQETVTARQNQLAQVAQNLNIQDIVTGSQVAQAGSGIGLARARGGGAAEIGHASGSLYTALAAARTNTQAEISLLTGELADPINEARRPQLTKEIAEAQAKLTGFDTQEAQQRRDVFTTGLDETSSAFGLQSLRARLSGASSSSVSGITARQVSFLSGAAADPQNPLSPTERDALQSQAAQLAYTQAQGVYADENGALSIRRAERGADTSRAQTFGSPLDVYSARVAGLQSDRDQIAQNNSELSRGNLTFSQRQDLQRQNVGLQSELATAPEQARQDAYNAERAILSDTQGQSRASLSRDVSIRGSGAFREQLAGDDQQIRLLQGELASTPASAVGTRARVGRAIADQSAARDEDAENSQVFRETADERTQDTLVSGAYRRARNAPFLSGPESNPLTAGNALLSNLQSRERGAEAALAASTDPLARERNTQIVEGYKDRINDMERDRLYNGLLPQEVQSRIGMPGGGAGVAVQPLAAVAAAYGGYNPTQGSFGAHPSGYHGGASAGPEGGTAGAFALHIGAGNVGGGTDAAAKTADNTKQLVDLFRDFLRHAQSQPNRPPMPMGQVAGYARGLNPAGM